MLRICLIAFLSIVSLSGMTYYVDKDGVHGTVGNNTNSGLSWNNPWATISKAAQTMIAGDSVIVAASTYRESISPLYSGDDANPITFFTNEDAVIAGSEPVDESQFTSVPGHAGTYRMYFPYFDVLGITQLAGHDSIIFRPYCDTTHSVQSVGANPGSMWYDSAHDTLYVHTLDGTKPDSILHDFEVIRRNRCIEIIGRNGIAFDGFMIRNSFNGGGMIFASDARSIGFDNCTVRGAGMLVANCRQLTVTHCSIGMAILMVCHGNSAPTFNLGNVDTAYVSDTDIFDSFNTGHIENGCSYITLERCKWWSTYHGTTHGFMVGGEGDQDLRNTHITFRNCEGGAWTQEGIVIMYTDTIAVENCDLFNFRVSIAEHAVNPALYHSTSIRLWNTMLHHSLHHLHCPNLFMITSYTIPEIHADYNCIYNPEVPGNWVSIQDEDTAYTLAQWKALSGQDSHSINVDPEVIDNDPAPGNPFADYHLKQGSPCINAGDPTYPVPPNGGSCIDIGAYEYVGPGIEENISIRSETFESRILYGKIDIVTDTEIKIFDAAGRHMATVLKDCSLSFPAGLYYLIGKDKITRVILVR